MNHKFKRIAAAVLSLGILFSSGMTAYATSKEEAKQKIAQLKQEQAQLESRLSELQAHKEDTEAYIRELDAEMETVITQIQETNERLDAINEKLEETEVKLQEAQDKADRQYAALKVRIKQMYEEGDTSLWDIIMKSSDISAILNSSEYISQISDYDNRLLADFNETLKLIEAYKAELEEQ